MNENEIKTTLAYKKISGASKAIILVSKASDCPDSFRRSAESQGVSVLEVSTVNFALANRIQDLFFRFDLS